MSAIGLFKTVVEADPPETTSGGNGAMIANLDATLCQPAAEIEGFVRSRHEVIIRPPRLNTRQDIC
jgi:hypothetical protein